MILEIWWEKMLPSLGCNICGHIGVVPLRLHSGGQNWEELLDKNGLIVYGRVCAQLPKSPPSFLHNFSHYLDYVHSLLLRARQQQCKCSLTSSASRSTNSYKICRINLTSQTLACVDKLSWLGRLPSPSEATQTRSLLLWTFICPSLSHSKIEIIFYERT